MTSQINPNYPVEGNPTTASVRANFATAQQEISGLQNNTQGAPFLPIAGGLMQGALTLHNDPTAIMHPVTLGYFQANGGGGGSGSGGIPDSPADGTLYGRQDGAWLHAVNTAELNAAVAAAPYLKLSGGNLTGLLTLSGPPTAALHAASKGYTDSTFVPLTGATLTGPLILAADPTAALGAATKQYIDVKNFVSQVGGSLNIQVVENTTGADRTPTIAGNITAYNSTSDGLKVQAKRLASPAGSSNVWGDGPYIQLYGPGATTGANTVTINAGNNAAGFASWSFLTDGSLVAPVTGTTRLQSGHLVIGGTGAPANPAVCCFDASQGFGAGMFAGASSTLNFATIDSNANFQTVLASLSSTGMLTLGQYRTVNDPLWINVAAGQNARTRYNVSGQHSWSCGSNAAGAFTIGDETAGNTRLSIDPNTGLLTITGDLQMTGPGGETTINMFGGSAIYSDATYWIIGLSGSATSTSSWRLIYTRSNGGFYMSNYQSVITWNFDGLGNLTLKGTLSQGSDARDKENITDAADGLALVRRIFPKRFNRIVTPHRDELGFVAQDIADVLPEAVITRDDDKLAIDATPILAVLANAAKQLDARLTALETKGH